MANNLYHYRGDSQFLTTLNGTNCHIDFGQPLKKISYVSLEDIFIFEIFKREESERCSGELITLAEQFAGSGVLSVGGFSLNDPRLNDSPRDEDIYRTRGHAYYIGKEAVVKRKTQGAEDTENCTIFPNTEVAAISFSEDLQFVLGRITYIKYYSIPIDWKWEYESPPCDQGESVYVSPEFLNRKPLDIPVYINAVAVKN